MATRCDATLRSAMSILGERWRSVAPTDAQPFSFLSFLSFLPMPNRFAGEPCLDVRLRGPYCHASLSSTFPAQRGRVTMRIGYLTFTTNYLAISQEELSAKRGFNPSGRKPHQRNGNQKRARVFRSFFRVHVITVADASPQLSRRGCSLHRTIFHFAHFHHS